MFNKEVWNLGNYHSNVGQSLFDIFKEYYAIKKTKIIFEDGSNCIIEKYNVIGWDLTTNIFNVYETSSLDKKLISFNFFNVIKVLVE